MINPAEKNIKQNLSQPSANQSSRNTDNQIGNHSGVVERCLRNFILGKRIGAGTFSKVCIAKHRMTNQQVAIKIIQKNKIENESDRIRLDRQIKIMRKVRHPNIAQLYQIIQTNKYIYLVMQYAARGELFDHIVSHSRLTQFESSKFLLQLTDAIEYLHQLGIAHRDLKPQNMLLDYKYNIKVTDFGLSNIYPAGKLLMTACGSPSYACPQMLSNKSYDGLKADIWSIGIVLYAMCFGYLPFDNSSINQLYSSIKKGQFQIPDSASANLIDILHRILNVDPQARATINEIRNHPFCKYSVSSNNLNTSIPGIIIGLSIIPYQKQIQQQMKNQLNLNVANLKQQIENNRHNQNTCIYYLILQRNLRCKNQSLANYFLSRSNIINRHNLIQKVKQNYQRALKNRMEIRKFHEVQQQWKNNGTESFNHDRQNSKNSPKTIKKQRPQQSSRKKIIHSEKNSNKKYIINQISAENQKSTSKQQNHFAPNNTKLVQNDTKNFKRNKSTKKKSQSNSKQVNKKSQVSKKKKISKKSQINEQTSRYLPIPEQFLSSEKRLSKNNSSNKKSRNSSKKKSKSLKNQKRSKTLSVQKDTRHPKKISPNRLRVKYQRN